MRIAIFSRPGPCFPNIICQGLAGMLTELCIENKIFYDGIPMLMRLLPLNQKPKRWYNNWQFRVRNKLTHYATDKKLLKELDGYDAVIITECYPNAFWKNYFAIEKLRKLYRGQIISYTDSPLDAAPLHKLRHLDKEDYDENIYDLNLFVTNSIEIKALLNNRQEMAGVQLSNNPELQPAVKKEFIAVVDFAQPGYDIYRQQQIGTLKKLGIKTIVLEGKYSIKDIRTIYRQAAVFFLSFPETFGLPIAECLGCGVYIFTPNSAWPMAWRLDEQPMPNGPGLLPDCFGVYQTTAELENMLLDVQRGYDLEKTPQSVFNTFVKYYPKFYYGDKKALRGLLEKVNA